MTEYFGRAHIMHGPGLLDSSDVECCAPKLGDRALAILFLAALVLGAPSAISGFRKIIEPAPPT
ncbi:MAG TPA: hypothetical protein VKB67_03920, partial [Rhizomicrobium sp.]|nr:hypothetical protein [Rhizomicrobium sp.]